MNRTALFGPDLADALSRADEVLAAHDSAKGQVWRIQTWQEHACRAIAHLSLALRNGDDGCEIEAAHGAIRALMALQRLLQVTPIEERRFCCSHTTDKNYGVGVVLKYCI